MAAMSIFFIVIMTSKARFASSPPAASASVSALILPWQSSRKSGLGNPVFRYGKCFSGALIRRQYTRSEVASSVIFLDTILHPAEIH